MNCPVCGEQVKDGDLFCGQCGARLSGTQKEEKAIRERKKEEKGETEESGKKKNSKKNKSKKERKDTEKNKEKKKDKKKKHGRKIVLFLVCFCVLAVGILALLMLPISPVHQLLESTVLAETNMDDNGNLVSMGEGFTDVNITDADAAILAAQDVAEKLGLSNAFDELALYVQTESDGQVFYRLQQYYNGVPVYGRYVIVVADSDGTVLSIVSSARDIPEDFSMDVSVTQDEVCEAIRAYAMKNWSVLYDTMTVSEISGECLVIYNCGDEAYPAYCLDVVNGESYRVVVRADQAEVLCCESMVSSIAAEGTDASGEYTFVTEYDEETDTYTIADEEKQIYMYNLNNGTDVDQGTEVTSKGDNIFGNADEENNQDVEKAVNLLTTVSDIIEYYQDTFGQEIPYGYLLLCYNDGSDGGNNAGGGNASDTDEAGNTKYVGFLTMGSTLDGTETDTVAHEYTHILEKYYGVAQGENDPGILEGLADTFSCFYNRDWDIDLTKTGGTHRNAENPGAYNYPESLNSRKPLLSGWPEYDDHAYATVISHAAYLMYDSGEFTWEELEAIWYRMMLMLPYDCKYEDLRFCMETAAELYGCTDAQIEAIFDAWDAVGIYGDEYGKSISLYVYDKYGDAYDDYNVVIEGETSGFLNTGFFSKDIYIAAGNISYSPYMINLENGTYTITVTDDADTDDPMKKTFEIKVRGAYDGEYLSAAGFGADYTVCSGASLTVLDINEEEFLDYEGYATAGGIQTSVYQSFELSFHNFYDILLSARDEHAGITYYKFFTLRVKESEDDALTVQTNFGISDTEVTFSGYVLDEDGDPLGNVDVSAGFPEGSDSYADGESYETQTDTYGYYELTVPLDAESLTYRRVGYSICSVDTVELIENRGSSVVEIEDIVLAETKVKATVVDAETGNPISDVNVNVGDYEWTTDSEGNICGHINDPMLLYATFSFEAEGYQECQVLIQIQSYEDTDLGTISLAKLSEEEEYLISGVYAYATSVISFTPGDPWTSDPDASDPSEALGAPNYSNDKNAVTFGAGGVLVLAFDVDICDGEGIDIYVYECGGDVEPTLVEVSNDLVNWTVAGTAEGALSGVDLGGMVPEGTTYRYVRLTDLGKYPRGTWPGADVDAVAIVNYMD